MEVLRAPVEATTSRSFSMKKKEAPVTPKLQISIDFPPQFAARWGRGKPLARHVEALLLRNETRQREFLSVIHGFVGQLELIDVKASSPVEPFWAQPWFPPLDGMSLYSMLAHRRPKQYIEIGSGNSTKFAHRATRDHGTATRITSIDPSPRAEIDAISDTVIRTGLESVELERFDELVAGDVVLFDGSHRSFMNSDVTVFFIDVLPRLCPGVVVGIHDIFWPNDYPVDWLDRYYNEQYLLGAYMIGAGSRLPILFASNWMGRARADEVVRQMTPKLRAKVRQAEGRFTGGCLWFQVPDHDAA